MLAQFNVFSLYAGRIIYLNGIMRYGDFDKGWIVWATWEGLSLLNGKFIVVLLGVVSST